MLPTVVVLPLLGNKDRLVVKFVFKIFEDTFGVFFWLLFGSNDRLATKDEGNFGVASLLGSKDLRVVKFILTDDDALAVVVFSRKLECKLKGVFFVAIAEQFSLYF